MKKIPKILDCHLILIYKSKEEIWSYLSFLYKKLEILEY